MEVAGARLMMERLMAAGSTSSEPGYTATMESHSAALVQAIFSTPRSLTT
jgi:hypothetical protein